MGIRRFFVAATLALALLIPASVWAQIAPKYYWGCDYYIFGWLITSTIVETSDPVPPGTYDGIAGWMCVYIGQCNYTQDINGTVYEFCS